MIPSPYRRGADDGFIFGIYLSVMFLASLYSSHLPSLSFLSLIMAVCVPVVIFWFIRRFDKQLKEFSTFPMLWMQGVVIFVCGVLIAGVVLVVYMKWIEPDFILNQLRMIVETGSASHDATMKEFADIADQMIKANFVPSPMYIVTQIILLAIVTGSILSIIIAMCLTIRRRIKLRRYLNK